MKTQSGFTLFVSVIVTGTLLLIATGMLNLTLKQSSISSSGRESQLAFYAADSGMECALYWDVKAPSGQSVFETSTGTSINCNQDANNPLNEWVVGGSAVSVINKITFLPEPYCAIVTVTKNLDGTTLIESLGYNSCDPTNPRRVERAVRATYGGPSSSEEFSLTSNVASAGAGDSVTISWTGLSNQPDSPSATNWIGFFPSGTNDFGYIASIYLGSCGGSSGGTAPNSGSCQFTIPGNAVAQGGYEFKLFENVPPSNGLSSINGFTVTAP